jgi:hypothetical protein
MRMSSASELLQPGTIIYYKLLPKDRPTNPDKEWRGRVLQLIPVDPVGASMVHVECIEEGYEGDKEYILAHQIVYIEGQPK